MVQPLDKYLEPISSDHKDAWQPCLLILPDLLGTQPETPPKFLSMFPMLSQPCVCYICSPVYTHTYTHTCTNGYLYEYRCKEIEVCVLVGTRGYKDALISLF